GVPVRGGHCVGPARGRNGPSRQCVRLEVNVSVAVGSCPWDRGHLGRCSTGRIASRRTVLHSLRCHRRPRWPPSPGKPMLIATHTHLFDDRFRKDLPAVLDRAKAAGVERVVCLGIDLESSRQSVEIANQYPLVVAAVGIQPNHAAEAKPGDWDEIVKLAESEPRVVAIGETGLDRYWDRAPFALQEDYFNRHIELARRLGK